MPRAAKSWCVRPCHNILNSIIGKNKFVKIGQNPTYPSGIHRIDAITAAHISRQYSLNTPSTSKQVFEGDKICTSCLRKISKQEFEYDNDEFDAIEAMTVDEDSPTLLCGLKLYFQQRTDTEQNRLLTISPDNWGRTLLLKTIKGILAFPEYWNGNKPLSEDTIKLVKEFYLQDGTSRASSRKKDVMRIDKVPVPVRFMEMTGREAYQQFIIQNPTFV
ncbi:unnamed protein product [Rotaria sp. Silwood2]|nr:unnamed protein product [Rotaria sp. Silwood2]